jgi:eukaryotic-like serine/threonine-protein kinase
MKQFIATGGWQKVGFAASSAEASRMPDERWQKIESIYHTALERETSHRAAYLEQVCEGDKALERELESLLAEAEETEDFLEVSAIEVAAKALANSSELSALSHPDAVGRYRILRLLGEGGMGLVYQAEQDEPRRTVALKMIRLGLATPDRLKRFRQEGQILADLAHPSIARLLDAGYTEAGAPFLVMEYVEGLPITQWSDEHKLNLSSRLRLFQKLCDAVQFAHQNLVVHRDLKPANVLVTPDGEPKLLDFGIAKLTDPASDGSTTVEWALTLDYTSPEQVRGGPITTAADIYSLGVLLHELITGKRLNSFSGHPLEEAIECISTRDPTPPSVSTTAFGEDLFAIVLKAMRKEPQERYASAKALGEDVERYLMLQPVQARRGNFRYIASKFMRRHRTAVAVGALVMLALCSAAFMVAREARIARQERDLAQRRFNDVQGLAGAVMFDLQDKLAALPGSTQIRKDLGTVAVNYLDALANDGPTDPALQRELATAYLRIGQIQGDSSKQNLGNLPAALEDYAKAERLARALEIREPSGRAKRLLGDVLTAHAYAAQNANQRELGTAKAAEALALARERVRSDPADQDAQFQVGSALQCAAAFYAGDKKLPYYAEEAAVFDGMLARDPNNLRNTRDAALAHKYIAGTLLADGDTDGAFAHLKRAEELDQFSVRLQPTPEHKFDLAIDMGQWGEYYEGKKDFAKAIQYTRVSMTLRRELASADPKDMRAQDRLVYILNRLGDLQLKVSPRAALASYQEGKPIAERLPESQRLPRLAFVLTGIGYAYQMLGDAEHGCPALREGLKLLRELSKGAPQYADSVPDAQKAYSRCPGASH